MSTRRYSKKVRERRRNRRNLHPSPSRRRSQARYAVARALAAAASVLAVLVPLTPARANGVFFNGSAYTAGAIVAGVPSPVGHLHARFQNFDGGLLWNWNGSVSFQLPIIFYDGNGVPYVLPILQLQDYDGTQFITGAPAAIQMDGNEHTVDVLYIMEGIGNYVSARMAWAYDGAGWTWTDRVYQYPGHAFAPALNNGAQWFSGWPGLGNLGSVTMLTGDNSLGYNATWSVYLSGSHWDNSIVSPYLWDTVGLVDIESISCDGPC